MDLNCKEHVLEFAYRVWLYRYYDKHRAIDDRVELFLDLDNEIGWLKRVRQALHLSLADVARKINVNKSTYSRYEKNEENETISLATLRKAAQALDCELIYGLRPYKRVRFSRLIWAQLLPYAEAQFHKHRGPIQTRASAIAERARVFMDNAQFRRFQKWSAQTFTTPQTTIATRRWQDAEKVRAVLPSEPGKAKIHRPVER